MRRVRIGLVAGVVTATAGCTLGGDSNCYSTASQVMVCVASHVVVIDERIASFAPACNGTVCDATIAGDRSFVDGVLPGETALRLEAGASVSMEWPVRGLRAGQGLAITARCDAGGTFVVTTSDQTRVPQDEQWSPPTAWTRQVWPLADSPYPRASLDDLNAQSVEFHVALRNTGSAGCEVSRVRFATSAPLCTQFEWMGVGLGCAVPADGGRP